MKKHILLAYILLFSFCSSTYALEKSTHIIINEKLASQNLNGFSLDNYLINQLGFKNGFKESFDKKQVLEWLGQGGKTEA